MYSTLLSIYLSIYVAFTIDYAKVLATCTHLIIAIFKYKRDGNIQKDVVNEWFSISANLPQLVQKWKVLIFFLATAQRNHVKKDNGMQLKALISTFSWLLSCCI